MTTECLTPSNHAGFENEGGNVRVDDPDEQEIHVESLDAHPGEGREREVLHGRGQDSAPVVVEEVVIVVVARVAFFSVEGDEDEVGDVEEDERHADVHEDLIGLLFP